MKLMYSVEDGDFELAGEASATISVEEAVTRVAKIVDESSELPYYIYPEDESRLRKMKSGGDLFSSGVTFSYYNGVSVVVRVR